MYYITELSLNQVFDLIRDAYTAREQVPDYRGEQEGIAKLIGVLFFASEYSGHLLRVKHTMICEAKKKTCLPVG
ncbi:MAG: hypothetical protein G01um101491_352, partial [Parcubacteria group bacterium Gr01-1014_91]